MFSFLAPYRLLIEAGLVLALVLGIYGYGHRQGAAGVQGKWDKAERIRFAEEASRKAANDKLADTSSAKFEAASAAINARHSHAADIRREALAAPAFALPAASAAASPAVPAASAPPLPAVPNLGDVRVGAGVLDSLRSAASAPQFSPEPAAGEPRAAVRSRSELSAAFGWRDDLVR